MAPRALALACMVLLAALAECATVAATHVGRAGPAAPASVAPRCHTAALAARLRRGSPGAGQRYATVLLRNRSARACSLRGFLRLQLVDARGRTLPTRVVRDRTRTVRRVTLAPGRSVAALLHWGAIPGRGEPVNRPCEPRPRRVRITPPGATAYLVLRWRFGPVCQHGRIEVRPLIRA